MEKRRFLDLMEAKILGGENFNPYVILIANNIIKLIENGEMKGWAYILLNQVMTMCMDGCPQLCTAARMNL